MEILVRTSDGRLDVENDFVRQAVEVENRIADRGIGVPERDAGPNAGLAHGALEAVAVNVFAPVAEFAETVGNNFERGRVNRPIDFLARQQALAVAGDRVAGAVLFPRKQIKLRGQLWVRRSARDANVGIGSRRMFEPSEIVADERLAEPVVVEARQPL